MSGQEPLKAKEQILIEQQGRKIWQAVKQHIMTLPHGNGLGCKDDHIFGRTTVKLYYVPLSEDEASVSSNTTIRVAVVAVTRHFPAEGGTEESNWRFTQEGGVTREGVLLRPGKRDLFTSNPPLDDGSTQHGVLDPDLKDLDNLLEIAMNPDVNIFRAGILSKLSEEVKKISKTGSLAQSAE